MPTVKETIYAVERRENGVWRFVGEHVFATREAAEHFAERYVEDDFSGWATTVDIRVRSYVVER